MDGASCDLLTKAKWFMSVESLRRDALAIWHAGVRAVDSARLVTAAMHVEHGQLCIGELELPLDTLRRIVVVGAGKAGAGMALGVEQALGDQLLADKRVTGWVNVPADCVRPTRVVKLHAARDAGVNEPTAAGVQGSEAILRLVETLGSDDLCLCLISGGGSALLPAPVEGVSLADKLALTRFLSGAGANIAELNTVRKQLSRIKGNGLARACRAGRLVSLIISDVLGDPLDVIASGPTVPNSSTPQDALAVLDRFGARAAGVALDAYAYIERLCSQPPTAAPTTEVTNLVIGNNATAVDAAGIEAVRLGYSPALISSRELEGQAEEIGEHLAHMALHMRSQRGPDCLISGGEPVVKLVRSELRGRGGRNQQLVLAALDKLAQQGGAEQLVILSGGTDGEDGPTDAAGAIIDADTLDAAQRAGLVPRDFLDRNDAYNFFAPLGGLIKTGPTHTNVCDVRVVVIERPNPA